MQTYTYRSQIYTQPKRGLWKAFKKEAVIVLIFLAIGLILSWVAASSANRMEKYRLEHKIYVNK